MPRRLGWSSSSELAGVGGDVALVEAIAPYGGFVSVDTGKEDGGYSYCRGSGMREFRPQKYSSGRGELVRGGRLSDVTQSGDVIDVD